MDALQKMIEAAYAWASRQKRLRKSVNGKRPMGIREAKREAIRQALLIPGVSLADAAELTGTSKATVQRVAQDLKRARAAAA